SVRIPEADGERLLQVVLRVGPEGDVRVGVDHARRLRDAARDHLGDLIELADPDDRDEVHPAGHGVDLADPGQVGQGLGHLRNRGGGAVDEDDRGNHSGAPSSGDVVTVPLRPYRTAPIRYSSGPTYPPGQTTVRSTRPSTVAPAPTTACATVPVTVAS